MGAVTIEEWPEGQDLAGTCWQLPAAPPPQPRDMYWPQPQYPWANPPPHSLPSCPCTVTPLWGYWAGNSKKHISFRHKDL